MTSTRRRLGSWAATTLVAFVAALAAPRPGFLVHQHAGGEHHHRHRALAAGDTDIDRLLAEALGPPDSHDHAHGPRQRPHFEAPGSGVPGVSHWHDQAPFQPAIGLAPPSLGGLLPFRAAALSDALPADDTRLRDTRARSPPPA